MEPSQVRITGPTLKVLGALMSGGRRELAGADIGRETKVSSGTLYPILARLERAGWVKGRWEAQSAGELGRPRRRLYQVTALGVRSYESIARELLPAAARIAWA